MEELKLLQSEMVLLNDTIKRLKKYKKDNQFGYMPYNTLIVGELKHRCVAMKQRLTIINKLNSQIILKDE